MNWFDAHCHLSEVAKLYDIELTLKNAQDRGINGWLSCALNKEEMRWHQLHRSDKILFSAGIHPFYDAGTQFIMEDLDSLAKEKQLFAIGEIGLDKNNRQLDQQIIVLKDQLYLARSYDLPVVFHVVGHFDVFFKILSDTPVRGIWHGFSATKEIVKQFSKFDLTFSIGQKLVTSLKSEVINEIIKYGNFLIETDSPYNLQKPDKNAEFNLNPLIELVNYARVISKINGVKLESLQKDMSKNAKQYFI